jgi:hypothetical protein
MCGCFVVALGAFFPRVALVILWLFGDTVETAFKDEWIVPLLGLFLLPYTTLSYVLLYWWLGDVTGFTWFFVVLAFLADMGSYAGSARTRR